jgi:hypothetical protein
VPISGTATISGSVGITGTPSVKVTNTPSVTLASGATVAIANPASPGSGAVQVRDVNNDLQPFQVFVSGVFIAFGVPSYVQPAIVTVPPGKRFVIEDFSADCLLVPPSGNTGAGVDLKFSVTTVANTITAVHDVGQTPHVTIPNQSPATSTSIGRTVKWYADPSTSVDLAIEKDEVTGAFNTTCNAALSGHLIDVP